jgi:hypothetical protein
MKIEWEIEKQRGNYRPTLKYRVILDKWERELNINKHHVKSTIPAPAPAHDIPSNMVDEGEEKISLYMTSQSSKTIYLPFRRNGEYPEVKESMEKLRDCVEKAIIQAHDSLALNITGSLEMTPATKKHVAAHVAAWKMTQATE